MATRKLESGDLCFALELKHLHPDRRLDTEAVTRDGVAFVTALEGQRDARFVLQTACFPNPAQPERGRLSIRLLVALKHSGQDTTSRVEELCDDLLDLLAAPPVRWSFEPVTDADKLASVLEPVGAVHLAEVARREEPCLPTRWEGGVGFGADPTSRTPDRRLWSMWTLGPSSKDLRRLGSVLLAQEAPVCIRVSLTPSAISPEERSAIEGLSMGVARDVPQQGLLRTSLHTLESLLYLRPLFDVRCVVASPEPLSRSMLSALGHTFSEPAAHGAPEPVLHGGFAVLRGDHEADAATLLDAYTTLSCGDPIPSLAPAGLERLRRLLGPWEAANIFRIPATDEDGFPGLETLRVPDLDVPLADLAKSGHVVGHLVGDTRQQVLIDPEERFRHLYVSGQTGTGKSTLLLNLALQDIESGAGVAVLDPHGDLVEALLGRIPEDRLDDVVLIDPADPVAVTGVNLLEAETLTQKEYVVSELAGMFYALFDPNRQGIIGPRYETWLRQAALLLLANPDQPSSFLDIPTVFVDAAVRNHLLQGIEDPILAEFWFGEMTQTSDFHKSEVLGWFRSKFEIFRTSALVRNVVGQARSTVSFSEIMSERRILLVNLSKGLLGEYNSALIGHIVFSRLWSAALERASVPARERADFFVYIDEFQNMTTDSLPAVLSEARKFRVGLTLANQFFSQVPELTRDAIMGNVGSRVTFRVGPKDAAPFASWLGSEVHPDDLTGLPNHVAVGALSAQGVPLDPFPFRTRPPADNWTEKRAEAARDHSRKQWAVPTGSLDASFFTRWAHVEGSASARLFAAPASQGIEVIGDSIQEPSFIETWIINRLLSNNGDDPVDVNLPNRPIGTFIKCVALLRRRFDIDIERAVSLVSATEGDLIEGVPRSHAMALRYELRLLGADLVLEPDRADSTDAPVTTDPGARSVAELGLSDRPRDCLLRAGVITVTDLISRSTADLLSITNFGEKSLAEVVEALAQRGLALRGERSPDGQPPNEAWLAAIGLGDLAAADRASLLEVARAELQTRGGSTLMKRMTVDEVDIFDAANELNDDTAAAVLDEVVPDRLEIIVATLDDLRSELLAAKEMIIRELAPNPHS